MGGPAGGAHFFLPPGVSVVSVLVPVSSPWVSLFSCILSLSFVAKRLDEERPFATWHV